MSTIVEKTSEFSGVSPCIHAWSSLLDVDSNGWLLDLPDLPELTIFVDRLPGLSMFAQIYWVKRFNRLSSHNTVLGHPQTASS